jgi:hypothetical protein
MGQISEYPNIRMVPGAPPSGGTLKIGRSTLDATNDTPGAARGSTIQYQCTLCAALSNTSIRQPHDKPHVINGLACCAT